MPGTSMMVAGSLAFQSGAVYLVQINPSTTSYANVSGTASLAGNMLAQFVAGGYVQKQYDILHSTDLGGTTFAARGTSNLPAGFTASLSYSYTDAYLNLIAVMGQQLPNGGLPANQCNVADGLNNFFNGGARLRRTSSISLRCAAAASPQRLPASTAKRQAAPSEALSR
jgi:hypothetical protein